MPSRWITRGTAFRVLPDPADADLGPLILIHPADLDAIRAAWRDVPFGPPSDQAIADWVDQYAMRGIP